MYIHVWQSQVENLISLMLLALLVLYFEHTDQDLVYIQHKDRTY